MTKYLIEFRFFGKAKKDVRTLIYEINRRFHVGKRKHVPHITLAGPFTTNSEKRLLSDFGRLCSQTPLMKFRVNGFDDFHDNRVVFIHIDPTERLDEFRWNLSQTLKPYCKLRPFDYEKKFFYHATLAMKLDRPKFNQVKEYVKRKTHPDYKHLLLRVTLLKNGKILREYDFLQRKLLSREQALNRQVYQRTMHLLNEFFAGRHHPDARINVSPVKKKSIIDRILDIFR